MPGAGDVRGVGGVVRDEHRAAVADVAVEPGTETREISDGLNVDLDAAGHVVGFDIAHASSRLDLSTLEVEALPLRSYKVG